MRDFFVSVLLQLSHLRLSRSSYFITFAYHNKNNMAKQVENSIGTVNLIASTTHLEGNVRTESDIRIDGLLKGNLTTSGRLIVGPKGNINGEITCKTAEVEGSIEGKINVSELLSLKASSRFTGEIITRQLMIEPGAMFSGNCKMNSTSEGKTK